MAGISASTVGVACSGKHISVSKATEIAEALSVPVGSIFEVQESTSGLAEKTVLHHHRLVSAILAKAKRERIVPFNVASEHATAPKVPQQ